MTGRLFFLLAAIFFRLQFHYGRLKTEALSGGKAPTMHAVDDARECFVLSSYDATHRRRVTLMAGQRRIGVFSSVYLSSCSHYGSFSQMLTIWQCVRCARGRIL